MESAGGHLRRRKRTACRGDRIGMKNRTWKKRMRTAVCLLLTAGVWLLTGCSQNEDAQEDGSEMEDTEISSAETDGTEETYIPVTDVDTETVYAETEPDGKLAAFLAAYYQIPDEYLPETRYYYDTLDLNSDGKDEILVVVVGEYTEQEGGDPALILSETEDSYEVLEDFPFLRTPVYVSKEKRDGWSDLIVPFHGTGDGNGYLLCHHTPEEGYQSAENEFLESFDENFCGKKILANNFIDDMDKGNYLTLADQ